jgi:hypothetical protein
MFGCTRCDAGPDRCTRCSARLCLEHIPLGGDACAKCELAYQQSRDRLNRVGFFLLGLALPWVIFAGIWDYLPSWHARSGGIRAITTGIPMLDVIIMFSVTSIIFANGAVGLREAAHRRAFLASRTPAR